MNEVLMCGTDPVGQLYKDTKAEATSIAPIEVSPAESSHSVGTHIMYGGIRYKVTSAINVGDTLTIGTNISAENIEDNLNADDIAYSSGVSVKDKIDDNEVLTKVVSVTIPANTPQGSANSSELFSSSYKLVSLTPVYTNDSYYYFRNSQKNYKWYYISSERIIAMISFSGGIGDSVDRTFDFLVAYKKI